MIYKKINSEPVVTWYFKLVLQVVVLVLSLVGRNFQPVYGFGVSSAL
jgi:hypothetical protein